MKGTQLTENNYLVFNENAVIELAVSSSIGDRIEQQDNAGFLLEESRGLVALCDGIGGQTCGREASSLAVDALLIEYENFPTQANIHSWLVDTLAYADSAVAEMSTIDGARADAGTTAVVVAINENELHWASIGDSRLYLFRQGESLRATHDHVYKMVLDQQLAAGEITEEGYALEVSHGGMLVSYLGIDGFPFVDANENPFFLLPGDELLLTTDGLYKMLSDQEIADIVFHETNISDACKALEKAACSAARHENKNRDNTTFALIKVKEKG